jgi:hypothetical protein
MEEKIMVPAIAVIGVLLLVDGVTSFAKRETKVYLGRRRRRLVVLTGTAGDIVAVLSALGGTVSVLGAVAFWAGVASFTTVFIAAAVSLVLRQIVASLISLLHKS